MAGKLHPDKNDDHGVIYLDKQILFAAETSGQPDYQ